MVLSSHSTQIIKSSAELITANNTKIMTRVFEILFLKYPVCKNLFTSAIEDKHLVLAEALSIYARNIDKIDKLRPALELVARKHIVAKVKPAHYPMVGIVLMQAMEDVLEEKASIELMDAWREAYKVIGNILMNIEEKIYSKQEH